MARYTNLSMLFRNKFLPFVDPQGLGDSFRPATV